MFVLLLQDFNENEDSYSQFEKPYKVGLNKKTQILDK